MSASSLTQACSSHLRAKGVTHRGSVICWAYRGAHWPARSLHTPSLRLSCTRMRGRSSPHGRRERVLRPLAGEAASLVAAAGAHSHARASGATESRRVEIDVTNLNIGSRHLRSVRKQSPFPPLPRSHCGRLRWLLCISVKTREGTYRKL